MRICLGVCLAMALAASVFAQREPVLKQINEPHSYYYREMYLPQLTTGPSSVAWSPDSESVVYSMGGSLWRQRLDSEAAEQITAGPGYDYQPDWSSDGRWLVFCSYYHDAIELWALDLQTREKHQLTRGGAVNVEPRFAPDGKRLAFVSTSLNGRFHVFAGQFSQGELNSVERLTGENHSNLPRYYYSQFDQEISPVWSRDGSEILYISNHGHIHGTGGFWRMKATPGAEAREIRYEETNWKSRPDFSPDGKRIVYASYLGQQWHQLWVMPGEGGDVFPLSYGDFDNINPRWAPDGRKIAFISNRSGNTSLWIQQAWGGGQTQLVTRERHYLKPSGTLAITVMGDDGKPTPARVFVTGEDGRAYAPDDAWMRADDNFDRAERPFEAHYFHTYGMATLTVPAGRVEVAVMKGFEHKLEKATVTVRESQQASLLVTLHKLETPTSMQAFSGDVHVHMNYGGAYRDTPKFLVQQASAEDLTFVEDLVVNKEQRIPDIAYFGPEVDTASTANYILVHGQEFHTSYWGHMGLLGLREHFLLPGYAAYPNTAAASIYPMNANVADLAHEQHALVGYVHPFDAVPDPAKDASLTNELPVDVALGKVDYIEAMGFSDHKTTASVWYRLLNCGFRLPTAAGTDAMANFASLRGPVGLNRVYAQIPAGPPDIHTWLDAIKHGRTFATNGPLLGFTVGGQPIGGELKLPAGENKVKFNAWMRSFVPVDHLEVICNGKVVRDIQLNERHEAADAEDTVAVNRSGWCLLRAWSDKAQFPVLDAYPYATTSPIYLNVAGSRVQPDDDAAYFIAWIDRLISAADSRSDWNTTSEKTTVLTQLSYARMIYAHLLKPGYGAGQ
jgi:TolB protein